MKLKDGHLSVERKRGQGMWLHESESNSIITEAYENKIFSDHNLHII